MKPKRKLPLCLKSALWSYDINKLDLEQDKELIITQVLNHGDWQKLKWLYSVYSDKDIKEVILHPRRGLWFEKALNFWKVVLDIQIPKKRKQKAIFKLYPTRVP